MVNAVLTDPMNVRLFDALYTKKCCILEINNFSDDKQIATSLHELIVIFLRCRMTTRRGF